MIVCDFNVRDVTGTMEDSGAGYLFICRVNLASVLGTNEPYLIYPTTVPAGHCSFTKPQKFFSYRIVITIRSSKVAYCP